MGLESLYDKYRISNSTAIPQFVGSTGDAAIKVATLKQGMYDTAQTTAGEISSMSQNALSMENQNDKALKNELVGKVQGKIGEWSARKDWENNVEPVKALGREYVQRAKELAAPLEQFQAWRKDELADDKKGLNPYQIKMLEAKRLAEYPGLKKDATGKFVGSFNGGQVAKNIDEKKFVDDALQGHVVSQGATETSTDNGIMRYKNASGWHVMKPAKIRQIVEDARKLSSDYKGYAAQEGEIASFANGQSYRGVKSIDELKDDPILKANVEKNMKLNGYTLPQAIASTLAKTRENEIATTMDSYAVGKYAQNDRTSVQESGIGAVETAERIRKKALEDDFRLRGEGANTVPAWATSYTGLKSEISNVETSLSDSRNQKIIAERQLANDPGNTQLQAKVDRLNQTIISNEKMLANNNSILKNTKDQAVIDMKLDDGKGGIAANYTQFVNGRLPGLTAEIKSKLPNGIADGNKKYSPDQIASAVLSGKFTTQFVNKDGGYTSNKITMPDGHTIELRDLGGARNGPLAILATIDKQRQTVQKIEDRAEITHKKLSEGFSVKANSIGFDKNEQEKIGDFGVSTATIYARPGSSEVYRDEDVRAMRFVPEKYNIETNRVTGYFKSADGKTITGAMDVEMNSNLKSELKTRIQKKNGDGSWNSIIRSMDERSNAPLLARVKPNTVLTGFPDESGLPTNRPMYYNGKQMHLMLDAQGDSREWVLTDTKGTIITDKDGEQFRTPNITDASGWLDQMTTKPK